MSAEYRMLMPEGLPGKSEEAKSEEENSELSEAIEEILEWAQIEKEKSEPPQGVLFEPLAEALYQAGPELFQLVGRRAATLGIGLAPTGESEGARYAFHLVLDLSANLPLSEANFAPPPRNFYGLPVIVKVTQAPFVPQAALPVTQPYPPQPVGPPDQSAQPQRNQMRPLLCGAQIQNITVPHGPGSAGCFIRHPMGYTGLLSCNHVLAAEGASPDNAQIVQPNNGSTIAELRQVVPLVPQASGGLNIADIAVAEIDPAVGFSNSFHASHPVRQPVDFGRGLATMLNRSVYKVGARTGYTTGKISQVLVLTNTGVDYDFVGTCQFKDLMLVNFEPGTPAFTLGGDSGSIVLDAADQIVGMVMSGNSLTYTCIFGVDAMEAALDFPLQLAESVIP